MTPKISVVMSVFNGSSSLAKTIDSILQQSETDFEFIIVDDGSEDDTPDVLRRYAAMDQRIRIIRLPNQGLTRALINGCSAARSRYIARQDAGDVSAATRLARESALLDRDESLAFVSCWTEYVGPGMEPLYVTRGHEGSVGPLSMIDISRENCVVDGPTHHGSVMFRRDAYEKAGGYRAEFYYVQDWDLWYRLGREGRFQIVPEVLYTAVVSPDGITSAARDSQVRLFDLSQKALTLRENGLPDHEILTEAAAVRPRRSRFKAKRQAAGLYFIGEALRRNRDRRARKYLIRSIACWPFAFRSWVRLCQALMLGGRSEG